MTTYRLTKEDQTVEVDSVWGIGRVVAPDAIPQMQTWICDRVLMDGMTEYKEWTIEKVEAA